MAREMGKPIRQGRAEAVKCAHACEYYADHGGAFLEPDSIPTETSRSFVVYRPLGVVLAVMPWNFPFWQVFRCAAPSLLAGNSLLLKHASNVTGCALALQELFRDAGFPAGLFQCLLISSKRVASVIEHPLVRAVTLTGSTPAGRDVAATAGRHLKKSVLELGGSDPYVVLEDAAIPEAARSCAQSRLLNSGQSCIAAKRFIVVEAVLDEFQRHFLSAMKDQVTGDPLDEKTTVGPLARHDLRDQLHDQVQRSLERGARLLLGGEIPPGKGAFYPPTILANVRPGMPAFDEETFGPVAALISAPDEAAALALANQSSFGLGAAVFTGDTGRGQRIATEELEAGSCFVNDFVKSDPRLPFGGIKESGYGRELSYFGIREFVNIKTIVVK
jgi:succinate-semialdehyde dehydrogenase/glutarate-semialdehyde dehydrogenase